MSSLLNSLVLYTKLYHKPFSVESLIAGLPVDDFNDKIELFTSKKSKSLFSRAALRAGLKSSLIKRDIKDMIKLQLPMILLLSNQNTCILDDLNDDNSKAKIIYPEGNNGLTEWINVKDLEKEYLGFAYMLKKEFKYEENDFHTLNVKQTNWFWDTLKLSKNAYLDVILASFMINIFILATPLFTMNVYDRVIPNNAQETLMVFTIGIILVYIFDFALKTLRAYFLELAAKKSDIIMSSIIFEKIMDLKLSSHPTSIGSFANNIKDFESIRTFFSTATMTIFIDLPFSIIFISVIYYIGGYLVLVPITTMLIITFYALIIKNPLKKSIESSHKASAKKNGILIESLQNIETIKTLGISGKRQFLWEESTGEIAQKNLKAKTIASSIPNITHFLIQLNTIFVIVFGVYLIQEFQLTMGGLIAVVILTSRTISPIGQVANLITNYADAKTSYLTLNEIVSRETERLDKKEFIQRKRIFGHIEFKNVSFKYPGCNVLALDNVSFTIEAGEKVGIIGRIGSGKSTIAKLILKLYDIDEGNILLDGIDINQIDPADIRKNIGYVSQDIHLLRGTVKDNITSSKRNYNDEDMIKASKISGVERFVHTHPKGYDIPIGERGIGLSGGQKQSIAIARALMQDSTIMLLDEPTNAMDNSTEKELIKNLKLELKDKSLFLITQKTSVLDLCDRVIVMHNGKVMMDDKKSIVTKKLAG
jgi:ATP-binding cassette subfamily C protein LapB